MIARYLLTYLAMFVLTSAICIAILFVSIGRIVPIEGAFQVTEAAMCDEDACAPTMPTQLPYFSEKRNESAVQTVTFRAVLPDVSVGEDLQAIYLPKYADHIVLRLNGTVLYLPNMARRHWSQPLFIDVPAPLLQSGENSIDLELMGRPAEGLELYPFFFGPKDVLRPDYLWRYTFGPAFARFSLAFIAILGLTYLTVWWQRNWERQYLLLGLSCACGCVVQLHFGYGVLWGGYHFWTATLHLSIASFALLIMKFVRLHLGLEELRIERTLLLFLVIAAFAAIVISTDQLQDWALFVNVLTGVSATAALTVYWIHRHLIGYFDFSVIFACVLLASALGLHEMVLILNPQDGRSFHLFHIVPVCISLLCLWVIMSQLVRSLQRYEVLTNTLHETVAEKTVELERSFARLARVERREAVDRERNRIMMDLHDGIGGQLVSTLAYMESTGNKDDTLKEALEAALRDLALVLDSLDSHDSLTTLLGMLRTRLEPLLEDHGLRFDWQIKDDPVLSQAGPSSNLHLARIVQEAITNVIKHANAQTITVYTDANTIQISDDGIGIDPACVAPGACAGHGLPSMRQRAESIGARFTVERTADGTCVALNFAPVTPENQPA